MLVYFIFLNLIFFFKSIKISVIIPIFNAEKYISDCLESIINQTLKDIEIILIDDGSNDKTAKIINKYAKKDKRIIIFRQKNKGAGAARNKGIQISRGEYISFIDSDDMFHYKTLEISYENLIKYNSDIVLFFGRNFKKKQNIKINENIEPFKIKNFTMKGWCCVTWNRVWRASIIKKNNITFGTIKSGEDNIFNAKIFPFLNKIIILDVKLVYHRLVKGSLSSYIENKTLNLYNSIPSIIETWKINNIINVKNSEKIFFALFDFIKFFNKRYKIMFYQYLIKQKLIYNNKFISNAGRFKDFLKKIELETSTL